MLHIARFQAGHAEHVARGGGKWGDWAEVKLVGSWTKSWVSQGGRGQAVSGRAHGSFISTLCAATTARGCSTEEGPCIALAGPPGDASVADVVPGWPGSLAPAQVAIVRSKTTSWAIRMACSRVPSRPIFSSVTTYSGMSLSTCRAGVGPGRTVVPHRGKIRGGGMPAAKEQAAGRPWSAKLPAARPTLSWEFRVAVASH